MNILNFEDFKKVVQPIKHAMKDLNQTERISLLETLLMAEKLFQAVEMIKGEED